MILDENSQVRFHKHMRISHRLIAICFYNGNTFVAIGRTLIQDLLRKMPLSKAHGFSERGWTLHRRHSWRR
jgi:hypothetical protein